MRLRKTLKWEWYLPIIFLLAVGSFAQSTVNGTYQDEEDVNARVARISFIRGDARIKREGEEEDWESARINLPIVEGDRIETEPDSALEIQFDTNNFLRIAGNSTVKITTLRDEGIAVSLSEGTLSLRTFFFDKDRGFFEIDAPQTTVSVQKEGSYRVDARKTNSDWVRVSVTDGGQARIYSQDSGFSIRSGRSAQIYIAGNMAGEWETSDAARFADGWDAFVAERDDRIQKSLKNSHYGKYYERDIYGAEDLNDYGEWIDSSEYGKVWRPYQRSTNQYANWSPYRYGSWQWVSPYGWTWVNDEPWGWATYHYGRWVSYRNTWVWCPYPSNRGRNRWRPALVAITYIDRDIHWYPLCYHQEYYDYNRHYRRNRNSRRDHRDHNRRDNRDDHRGHNRNGNWNNQHAIRNVPHSGVVSMPGDDFGRRRGRIRSADWRIAQRVLENEPRFEDDSFRPERRRDQRVAGNGENQRRERDAWRVRTGAADRRAGAPMEREINDTRVFNDRRRIERRERNQGEQNQNEQSPSIFSPGRRSSERSDTGAVERQNRRRDRGNDGQNNRPEGNSPVTVREKSEETTGAGLGGVARPSRRERNPENSGGDDNAERERRRERRREQSQPPATTPPFNPNPERSVETRREEPRREERRREERRVEEPRVETPRREERRSEPRREESRREEPRREERRANPPRVEPRREEPRQEAPRREEPRREAPRREEPKREEPKREEKRERPPQNNNSESEKKTRPSIVERKKDPDDN